MKKFAVVLYVLATVALLAVCTQCKKEPVCEAIIHVHKTLTGLDTADAVPNCYVTIGQDDSYAEFAKAEGYTDANGIFSHTFRYEALLDVVATYSNTYVNENNQEIYEHGTGANRIKLVPGEVAEIVVLIQ